MFIHSTPEVNGREIRDVGWLWVLSLAEGDTIERIKRFRGKGDGKST